VKLISHRGNLSGPRPNEENNPNKINFVIQSGYDVEVDVWSVNSDLFLGHDEPKHLVGLQWFLNNKSKLWIHCKNIEALLELSQETLNVFWHQEDNFTLTSAGYIWTYPGNKLTKRSIAVMPENCSDEWSMTNLKKSFGICTDYIYKYEVV
jgi:hypothetical protein